MFRVPWRPRMSLCVGGRCMAIAECSGEHTQLHVPLKLHALQYTALPCPELNCTCSAALHCSALQYTTLHYTALPYTTLQCSVA